MIVQSIPIPEPRTITAAPLTRESFASFGTAIANPCPDRLPSNTSPEDIALGGFLPYGAVSANQGSAIQYRKLAPMRNFYRDDTDGSKAATPRMTMFVCGARDLGSSGTFKVGVLERHPFTTQTFIPLGVAAADQQGTTKRCYLVIVAPSLPATQADIEKLPSPPPAASSSQPSSARNTASKEDPEAFHLPGPGLPDLSRLTAFIATGDQAVTYGPGTWHAPMVALGPAGSAIDFVVVQFANDVPVEDCQEVELLSSSPSSGSSSSSVGGEKKEIIVQVPQRASAKL